MVTRHLAVTKRIAMLLCALAAHGCAGGDGADATVRGRGLAVAELPPEDAAQLYDAAIRAAFDLGPGMTLLLAPEHLPRGAGLAGGPPVSPEVVSALRRRGSVRGTCASPAAADSVPRCEARAAGYLVRLSEPLARAGDTVQVYLDAARYAVPGAPAAAEFHFGKAYQLVRRGGRWRVAREGRVGDEARERPE
jgi:hypothetical protein